MSSAPPAALLIGGRENALSVGRVLARRGIAVIAVGEPESIVRRSRYIQFHAGNGIDEWYTLISERAPSGTLIMPCCDEGIELVATRHDLLVGQGFRLLEFDPGSALQVLDKESTYQIARSAGIGTPITRLVADTAALDDAIGEIGLPSVLKPVHVHRFRRHFTHKLMACQDEAELRRAWRLTQDRGLEMLLTEIIPGAEDRYCSVFTYIDADGEPAFLFTKRKLRQHPPRFGAGTYHVTQWMPDVAEAGMRFFTAAGVRGVANAEFKRDPRDGSLKLIECNARFTATNDLVRRAGIDLASLAYNRAVGLPSPVIRGHGTDGLWMWYPIQDTLAFLDARRRGELTLPSWLGGLAHRFSFPLWAWHDPAPSLIELSKIPAQVRRRLAHEPDHATEPDPALVA